MPGIKVPPAPSMKRVPTPKVSGPRPNPLGKPPLGFSRVLPPRLTRRANTSTRNYAKKGANSVAEDPLNPSIKSGAGFGDTGLSGES
jgi:hypothetical protein